jgi:hypothetical protein
MRRCDGILSANFRGCTVRATRLSEVGLKPDLQEELDRVRARSKTFFGGEAKFICQPLDNAHASASRKNFCASKISTEAVDNFWIT